MELLRWRLYLRWHGINLIWYLRSKLQKCVFLNPVMIFFDFVLCYLPGAGDKEEGAGVGDGANIGAEAGAGAETGAEGFGADI